MLMQSVITAPHTNEEIELCIYGSIIDFVIRISLHYQSSVTNAHAVPRTRRLHRIQESINEDRVQKRGQRAPLRHSTVHWEGA